MAYGLCYANGPRVTLDTLRALALEAGLTKAVARLDQLEKVGTRYSYEDFDILSSVSSELYRMGIDASKGVR
jgi:hypothetical protein